MIKLNKTTADEIRVKIEAGDYNLKELLKDVDLEASLPYVLVICKECDGTHGSANVIMSEELRKIIDTIKHGDSHLVYTKIIPAVEGYPREDVQYVLDNFSGLMKNKMMEFGFLFLNKYKLTIEPL